jgi:hypothetical protein
MAQFLSFFGKLKMELSVSHYTIIFSFWLWHSKIDNGTVSSPFHRHILSNAKSTTENCSVSIMHTFQYALISSWLSYEFIAIVILAYLFNRRSWQSSASDPSDASGEELSDIIFTKILPKFLEQIEDIFPEVFSASVDGKQLCHNWLWHFVRSTSNVRYILCSRTSLCDPSRLSCQCFVMAWFNGWSRIVMRSTMSYYVLSNRALHTYRPQRTEHDLYNLLSIKTHWSELLCKSHVGSRRLHSLLFVSALQWIHF